MKPLFFDLQSSVPQAQVQRNSHTSCDRLACFCNRPGALKAKALGFLSPVCAFLSLAGRCGLFDWSSIFAKFLQDA